MKTDADQKFLIGCLAKRAGVKTDTIRFYERSGLIPKTERKASGYRVYGEIALKRLLFIKKAQSLGFSLDEVRRILNLRGQGSETCQCVISMAETKLTEMVEKLREMERFTEALSKNLMRWHKISGERRHVANEFCQLIESTLVP